MITLQNHNTVLQKLCVKAWFVWLGSRDRSELFAGFLVYFGVLQVKVGYTMTRKVYSLKLFINRVLLKSVSTTLWTCNLFCNFTDLFLTIQVKKTVSFFCFFFFNCTCKKNEISIVEREKLKLFVMCGLLFVV